MSSTFSITPKVAINFIEDHYQFCRKFYTQGVAGNWVPGAVSLAEDREMLKFKITDAEKSQLKNMVAFFSGSENIVQANIMTCLASAFPIQSVRTYLSRQTYEEANHDDTFTYIIKELELDRDDIISRQGLPSIQKKKNFDEYYTEELIKWTAKYKSNPTDENTRGFFEALLKNLVAYYAVLEGIYFFSGFVIGINFQKKHLLPKTGELIKYILGDEARHLTCGMQLALTLMKDNQHLITEELKTELVEIITEGVEIEKEYAREAIGDSAITRADNYISYVESIADKRLAYLGLPKQYFSKVNAMKHLITNNDAPEMTNFFETESVMYEKSVV
jgi:ribonucleoside-diphosphate reductase beta chain